jgi:hypothetical protein
LNSGPAGEPDAMELDYCPHCGAELPPRARACPECGSDETTGWSDRAHTERLGIPDEEFNYDEFVREEFGQPRRPPRPMRSFWWVAAVILLLILLGAWVFLLF